MALKFRFRWIPFLAALIAAAVGVSLGQWQTRRALEKEAIEMRLSEREREPALLLGAQPVSLEQIEFRRIRLRGRFVPDWNVFLDNRPYDGAAGFQVLTPFQLDDGQSYVLVNRGWTARNVADRMRVPAAVPPSGTLEIVGVARRHTGRLLQLGTPEPLRPGAIVQNAEIEEFARAGRWQMRPFVIEQISDVGDGLVRDWLRPSSGADKHRAYAFQWYALAGTALMFFFVTGFAREPK